MRVLSLLIVLLTVLLSGCESEERRPPLTGPLLVEVGGSNWLTAVPGTNYAEGSVQVRNAGTSELAITALTVQQPGFSVATSVADLPTLFAEDTVAIPLRYEASPDRPYVAEAMLTVESTGGTVNIWFATENPLSRGVCRPVPTAPLAFADTEVGTTRVERVTIGCDTEQVRYSNLRIEPANTPFSVGSGLPSNFTTEAGDRETLDIRFTPTTSGTFMAEVVMTTSGGVVGDVRIPIGGRAFGPPACLELSGGCRVEGSMEDFAGALVAPVGSTVECLALTLEETDAAVSRYQWEVRERPTRSNARFALGDRFSATLQLDTDGLFVAHLDAVPFADATFCGPQVVRITAEPVPAVGALEVELNWDVPGSDAGFEDVDIHLLRSGACWGDATFDANWVNSAPDWGEPGIRNDPEIDADLPESQEFARVSLAESVGYRVAAHVVDIPEDTEATVGVIVRLDDAVISEREVNGISAGTFIELYELDYDGSGFAVTDSTVQYESYEAAQAACLD